MFKSNLLAGPYTDIEASASYEYKNKPAERGVQLVPMEIPI